MKKQNISLLLFLLLFPFGLLFLPKIANAADVVMNEFLVDPDNSQWIELFNKSDTTIDITGWVIDDDGGSQKFTVLQATLMGPQEYKVFESSLFNFNRTSRDTARLLSASGDVLDAYAYSKGPGENKTFGRGKDGEENWVVFSSTTKGSSNTEGNIEATPTPTNSPTPNPSKTPTPTPTKVPTPTKIPTDKPVSPAKNPTALKTPTPTKIQIAVTANSNLPVQRSNNSAKIAQNFKIATDFARLRNITVTPRRKEKNVEVLAAKDQNFSGLIIIGGIILFLAGGSWFALKYLKDTGIYEKIFNK